MPSFVRPFMRTGCGLSDPMATLPVLQRPAMREQSRAISPSTSNEALTMFQELALQPAPEAKWRHRCQRGRRVGSQFTPLTAGLSTARHLTDGGLTDGEVEKLIEAAGDNRHGQIGTVGNSGPRRAFPWKSRAFNSVPGKKPVRPANWL